NTTAAGVSWSNGVFIWQNNGGLYSYSADTENIMTVADSELAISSSYEYISNDDYTAVVWTESSGEEYLVKASFCCDNRWSSAITLMTGEDDTVAFMDAQMLDDGIISMIMNAVSYDDEGDIELTSLKHADIVLKTDLALTLADPEYPDWENQTQNIDIVIKNKGEYPVYSADVYIETEDEVLSNNIVSLDLMPGESKVISQEIHIGDIDKLTEATVGVDVSNDWDYSDNEQTVTVGQTDVAVSLDTYIQDDEYLFVITSENRSNTDANAAISIIEDSLDGVVLSMKDIGVVSNADNIQYLYTVDRTKVDFGTEDTKTFFIVLSALEEDWYEDDNVCSFTMEAPAENISDPDASTEVVDIVDPISVTITQDALTFSSVESEPIQLQAQVLPENATNTKIFWEAKDDAIVYVSEDGVVTPLKLGSTVITARVGDDITDTVTVSVGVNRFTDVKESHWFANAVNYCVQKGYVSGMTPTTFVPNGNLTRAQFIMLLAKLDGVDLTRYSGVDSGFQDVKTNHWYNQAVCWAVENKYTSGISLTKFGPNNNVTRSQVARFFYVYTEMNGDDVSGMSDISAYPDVSKVPAWAEKPIKWAVNVGLISGVKKGDINYLDPNGNATRAQATVMFKGYDVFRGVE
ncbi:MAG: S-layer homology domain-containing protein, partial [Clostridia bacterium]|nr:S-layer homology domain-containing protein [Clostridia bacterium]